MTTASQPAESGNNTSITNLFGEFCPACKSTEAWHPCVTEDDSTKYTCDQCAYWVSVQVVKPKQPKPRRDRRFELTAAFQNGHFFVEFNDNPVLTFRPGKFLEIGGIAIASLREIADREDAELYRGLDAGRKQVMEEITSGRGPKAHHITLHTFAPGRVSGECSCGEWHPVAGPDAETMWESARAHREEAAVRREEQAS